MRRSQLIGVYRRIPRARPKIPLFRGDPVVTETIFEWNSPNSKSWISTRRSDFLVRSPPKVRQLAYGAPCRARQDLRLAKPEMSDEFVRLVLHDALELSKNERKSRMRTRSKIVGNIFFFEIYRNHSFGFFSIFSLFSGFSLFSLFSGFSGFSGFTIFA